MSGRGFVVSLLAPLVLTGCMKAAFLADQEIVGGRHVKYILKQSAILTDSEGNKEQLFHYYVRICDLDPQGNHVNCNDSLILKDVSVGAR